MILVGRNKKPLELVKGNHVSKQEADERKKQEESMNAVLKKDKVTPPDWLDDVAAQLFNYYVCEFENTKILSNLDVLGLATYCDLHSMRLQLREDVSEHGVRLTQTNSRGGQTHVVNPSQTQLNQVIKQMQAYESKFGLTPVDRIKLVMTDEPQKEPSEFEKKFGNI